MDGNRNVPGADRAVLTHWACVDVPALPLQLLARRHPEWAERPMAVVAEDRPQGAILWVNERAYRARVLPGLRYAAALGLCRELCAGEVAGEEIDAGLAALATLLRTFTPHVEPAAGDPGVFWLDATGLVGLERSLHAWAARVRERLREDGFVAHLAVGFSRFGVYSLARAHRGVVVSATPESERAASRAIPLDRLHLQPRMREDLARLGVRTVGALIDLPIDGLGKRFGKDVLQLVRLATDDLPAPLQPLPPPDPIEAWVELEYPEADASRLAFIIQRLLHQLVPRLRSRAQALTALRLHLLLDDRTHVEQQVRTAEPTLQVQQVMELVMVQLERLQLAAGAVEIRVHLESIATAPQQRDLFDERPRRDLSAANRALARLRTEFGRQAVVSAQLRQAHLPEASFSWEPLEHARLPAPREVGVRPLIRRIFDRPVALPHRGHHEPDGWLVRGPEQGPMVRILGPYTVSGGWWVREVQRDYHYVETRSGDVLWVYYDRRRRRWFLHGQVE